MSTKNKPECRVLQIFSTLGVGGAEVWLIALLRYFNQIKDELPVHLKIDVLLTGGPGEFDEEAKDLGARLFYVPYSRRRLHSFIPTFRKILASGRYHAIHDHQDYVAGIHFSLGLGHLPPVRIVHVHNPAINIEYFASNRVRRAVLFRGKYLVGRLATHILGTSREILTDYGFDEEFFSALPRQAAHCGFDVSRYLNQAPGVRDEVRREFGWTDSAKLLLFVGRLNSNLNQKNPGFAIEVARKSIEQDPSIRMLVVGGGDEIRTQLEAETKSWGLQDSIRFAGVRTDVPRLMMASDLFLFPSVGEGLGMVAVEAQAAGLRVLASDVTPRECMAIPGGVQFLALDDGAAKWAGEVLRLLALPRPSHKEWNAIVRSSAFSIENSAASLLNIYQLPLARELGNVNPLVVELARN